MTWKNIHDDAPVDEQGIPRHPDDDKDHAICAAPKSDRASKPEHGRDRDDVDYCTLAAGWGVDGVSEGHCTKHGATKTPQKGPLNPNYRHGLYAEIDEGAYDDGDLALLDELDGTDEIDLLEQLIRIHGVRYRRAHDALPAGLTLEQRDDSGQKSIQLQPGEMQLASLGGRLGELIQRYHKLTEGEQINVDQTTEITGDASITVGWEVAEDEREEGDD